MSNYAETYCTKRKRKKKRIGKVLLGIAAPMLLFFIFTVTVVVCISAMLASENSLNGNEELTPITVTGTLTAGKADLVIKYGEVTIKDITGPAENGKFTAATPITGPAGKVVKAKYTGYYPENSLMEGGFYDCRGRKLNPAEKVVAAPKNLSYGSKVTIMDTGTDRDGVEHTIRDVGQAINVEKGKVYHFDILFANEQQANRWGVRKGKAIIGGSDLAVKVEGTYDVEKEAIVLEGTIGGVEIAANGTLKGGKVEASGYYGEGAKDQMGEGTYTGGKMSFPFPDYVRISSHYVYRHCRYHGWEWHRGVDLAGPAGKPVYAAADGTVTCAGWAGSYGKCVKISHGKGLVTIYGHSSKVVVHVGDKVKAGQKIAECGSTGNSSGPHCHFEVNINGQHTSPKPYIGVE